MTQIGADQLLRRWDPFEAQSWAAALGLVYVPMFGTDAPRAGGVAGAHSILLDGRRASVAFSVTDEEQIDPQDVSRDSPLAWAWSSRVRHLIIVNRRREKLFVRRWDDRSTIRQFKIPSRVAAEQLLAELQAAKEPSAPDVIEHVMSGFRYLRRSVRDSVSALYALNLILLAARAVSLGEVDGDRLRACRSLSEVARALPEALAHHAGPGDIEIGGAGNNTTLPQLISYFLDPDPRSGYCLRADLLFRHAGSQLYQEAHLDLERDPQGVLFVHGLQAPTASGPRDVRYTPANLARALAQRAIEAMAEGLPAAGQSLVVTDPACGSGIFLQECLRELAGQRYEGDLKLNGIDVSAVSKTVASSCLHLALLESPTLVPPQVEIVQANAIQVDWPESDLVLMNPPFIAWQAMDEVQQRDVQTCLRIGGLDLVQNRPDMAMAFLWKAYGSLKVGGVLAAVLPGAVLENESGLALRSALHERAELLMVGRFEGFSYFSSSLVETAFLILRKRVPRSDSRVEVLVASEGSEDRALRVLRGASPPASPAEYVELFSSPSSTFGVGSWLPRRRRDLQLLEQLDVRTHPKVTDLFDVHQGIRTGSKRVFLLQEPEFNRLPRGERGFFRPSAGQGTIRDGRLFRKEFVFYPFAPGGAVLVDEDDVRRKMPKYYEFWLAPNQRALEARPHTPAWWLPARARNWQYERMPKLASTYFGGHGSFAFDESGEYAVVEGFAWLWRGGELENPDDPESPLEFVSTGLPYAYLTILNSHLFERIVGCVSWRLQGGQVRLENRFLRRVPLPDLRQDRVPASTMAALIRLGRSIAEGGAAAMGPIVERVAAEAYDIPQLADDVE